MPAINAITPDKLARLIGTPACPLLIDVRESGDFIPGAVRRDPDKVADWAAEIGAPSAILICHHGGSASAAAAAWLRHAGIRAELLEGGVEAWVASGLPLVREAVLPPRDAEGRTRWVTRARPKVDRIACPWLIRRSALARLAIIVRGADTARPELAPQAAGLLAVSLGLSRMYADDLEQLEAGMLVYDAFYRWCRDAVEETHDWVSHRPKARVKA